MVDLHAGWILITILEPVSTLCMPGTVKAVSSSPVTVMKPFVACATQILMLCLVIEPYKGAAID